MRRHENMRVILIVSVVTLSSSWLAIGPLSNQADAGMTWLLETVASQGGVKTTIDIDSAGNPWILHASTLNPAQIFLVHWDGFKWVTQQVAEGYGLCSSFGLDNLDHPHVVYDVDPSVSRDMHYAYWNGASWINELIDSEGDLGSTCSIALDSLGKPHVSYEDYSWTGMNNRRDLKYAWRDSFGWHNETVDWHGWVGPGNSVAIDSFDRPHIAYDDYDNKTLKHAWWDGSKWYIEVADPSGEVLALNPTSIKLDSLDRPHVAYTAGLTLATDEVRYARWNGLSWTVEPAALVATISGGDAVSLRLDSSNRPSIAYTNATGYLSFTSKQGSDWVVENIDAGGGSLMGDWASLVLDSAGNPHISYADGTHGLLKYAHRGMDSISPSSSVDGINPYWASSPRLVTATASDGESRVSNVTLWYRFSTDDATWGSWKMYEKADGPSWSWTFTFPDGQGYYQFYSVAVDTGGNVEPPPPAADAIAAFEQTKPVSALQSKSAYWLNSTPLVLTATAFDVPSGVESVDLYYNFSGNNVSWSAGALFQTDSGLPWSWDFNFPRGAGWYRLYSVARDRAGNLEDPPAACDLELAFDLTPPTTRVDPIPAGWRRFPVDITARASDARSGVANVALRYRYSPDQISWNAWTYFQTDPAPPWSWSFAFPEGDGFYQFHSVGTDNASNSEWYKSWPEANTTYDDTPPVAIVDQSPPYWWNASAIITATVSDATSGEENATLWYRFSADNTSWELWTQFMTDVTPPWSWSFDFPGGPGHYQFQGTAFDKAGNEDTLGVMQEAELGFDPDAPSASLTIRSPSVSDPPVSWVTSSTALSLTAYDDNGSGVETITYRTWDGGWSSPAEYSAELYLTGTDGLRYLEFQATDLAGNRGLVENRTFVLDNTPPVTTMSIGDPKHVTGETFVRSSSPLVLSAADGGVGFNSTFYRLWAGFWSTWEMYSSPFTLAGSDGTWYVEYLSYDRLGNRETIRNVTLVLDDAPPVTAMSIGEPKYVGGSTFVRSSADITLSSTDGGAGFNSTFYRLWGGSWSSWGGYSLPFTLTGRDGTWFVEFLSYDYIGNAEEVQNVTLALDDSSPTTTLLPTTGPYSTDTWFTFTASDSGCGVNVTRYRIDGGSWITYSGGFTLPDGIYNVSYFSNDMLNNSETERWLVLTVSGATTPPSSDAIGQYWWLVVVIVAVVMVLVLFFIAKRRKPVREEPPTPLEKVPPDESSQ